MALEGSRSKESMASAIARGRSFSPLRYAADLVNYVFNALFVIELAIR
jgi:hypothetical protein